MAGGFAVRGKRPPLSDESVETGRAIYLDHNATTPLRPAAREAMRSLGGAALGNASSAHRAGARARAAVEEARRIVAGALGAQPNEIIFTSGGTESNNLALFGGAGECPAHLVVSPIEHASVLGPVRELERRGTRVQWLPVDGAGRIDVRAVAAALRPETALVSVGWANHEIGIVQPIADIAELCRVRQVALHVDAVQALGKVSLQVGTIDFCSFSAHKIGGPMGVGALRVRRGATLRPIAFGGSQERGLRPGTENVAGVVGFAGAVGDMGLDVAAVVRLRERLWGGLSSLPGMRRNSTERDCLPNTLHVSVDGVRGETLVAALDLEGVAVSAGAACSAGSAEPSAVLLALGFGTREAAEGVRFSLGPDTTQEEIDAAIGVVERVVGRLIHDDRRVGRG